MPEMKKMTEEEEDKNCDAWIERAMMRMAEGLDTASAVAVVMGFEQKDFMRAAKHSFLFFQRWNKASHEEKTNSADSA